jgi:hypothetical protein
LRRVTHDLHGGVVDEDVFELDGRILFGDFFDNGAPQARRFQYVGFIDGGDYTIPIQRSAERGVRNGFDLVFVIARQVRSKTNAILFTGFLFAEVSIAEKFADEEDVDTACGDFVFQRTEPNKIASLSWQSCTVSSGRCSP